MIDWDKMPVAQKSSLIRMFVENGITDVGEMRHIYAEGGVMDESDTQDVMQEPQQDTLPGDYDQWMNSMALKLSEMSNNSYIFTLCDIADNRDFDYSGMYNDNPQYAWSLLDDGNPDFYELGKMIYGEPELVMKEIEQISDTEGDITQNEYADGGELEHPVPPEYNDMARVLTERYKNLNFVQRALNPDDYPYIEDENGDRVTHLMEVSDDGAGNYFIYPTVVQKYADNDLEVLDSDDAFSHAMKTGEYITVPNKDFAIWYSNNGLIDHLHDSEGNEYAEGGPLMDWDPTHPYHLHTEDGKKIAFDEEAYNALPDNLKQQVVQHQEDMDTFENRYMENPEWRAFIQKAKNANLAENVRMSSGEYWNKNWYDSNYKSGLYHFDDNGILSYNGQTYAPWGERSSKGIVVPMRTPKGISYGANYVYYPVEVPQQWIERQPQQIDYIRSKDDIETTKQNVYNKYIQENSKTLYFPSRYALSDGLEWQNVWSHYPVLVEGWDGTKHLLQDDYDWYSLTTTDKLGFNYLNNAGRNYMKQLRDSGKSFESYFYPKSNSVYIDFPTDYETIKSINSHYLSKLKKEYQNDIKKWQEYLKDDKFWEDEEIAKMKSWIEKNKQKIADIDSGKTKSYIVKKVKPNIEDAKKNATISIGDLIYEGFDKNSYAKGGKIHIKKENRGKFTAAAKRAGKSVQEYARQILANKERYSPTLVKRANFARNASKWHDDGGFLNPDDPPKSKNLIANPDFIWKNMSSAQNGFAKSFIGSLKPAPIPAKAELKYKAVTGRDDFKESVLPVMKGDYIKTSQVFDNQLKQDGKDFDLEDFHLNVVETAYPNATKAVSADRDYVKRAVDAEHIIPMDYSKTITLSNAGNLTNAKVPTSLIDAVVENANKRSYDPYIMLGIMGRETTFGQFDPYQSVHPKEANYMVNRANVRSVSDLSNNHNYYVSPIRGEINQTYKNRNIDIPDYYVYGSPLLAQDTYNNINSWIGIGDDKTDFDTRNMRNLIEKTNNTAVKDDWESMMDSYYSRIYTNMNLINETIENLRNSPELQKYIESLSKKSAKQ